MGSRGIGWRWLERLLRWVARVVNWRAARVDGMVMNAENAVKGREDEGGRWKLFYKEVKATRVQIGAREEKRIGQSFRFSHRVEGIGFEIGRHVIHPLVCHLVISF